VRALLAIGSLLLIGLAPASASAHGGNPSAEFPFIIDGELDGGGANYGILRRQDGAIRWVCEETLNRTIRWWRRTPDDRVLAGTNDGLWVSADGACSGSRLNSPLDGHDLANSAVDPGDASRLFVVTQTADATNGVFVSTNGGLGWVATGLQDADAIFYDLLVAPGSQDLWAAGLRLSDVSSMVLRSTDGGSVWEPVPADLSAYGSPNLLGVSPDGGTVFLSGRTESLQYTLMSSADGLDTVLPLSTLDGEMTDFAIFQGRYYLTLDRATLFVSDDAETWLEVVGGPSRCLHLDGAVLWGCGGFPSNAAFYRNDGSGFEPSLLLLDILRRDCPEGTAGAEVCDLPWADLNSNYGFGPAQTDETPDDSDPDCGCEAAPTSGLGSGLAVLLLAPLVLRRRRRRS
jgi:MYXO-CTERM domain-containing protein